MNLNREKKASPADTLDSANNLVNNSMVGNAFFQADLAKQVGQHLLFKRDAQTGKLGVRTQFNRPFGFGSDKHWFNAPRSTQGVAGKILQKIEMSPHANLLGKLNKGWNFASGAQMALWGADTAAKLLGFGKNPIKMHVPGRGPMAITGGAEDGGNMIHRTVTPIGSKPLVPPKVGGPGSLSLGVKNAAVGDWYQTHRSQALTRAHKYYQLHAATIKKHQKVYRKKVQSKAIIPVHMITIAHHRIPVGKKASLFREASMYEMPILIKKYEPFSKEFGLESKTASEFMIDRTFFQSTYVLGEDVAQMKGFINGGMRPMKTGSVGDLYVRAIWVDPRHGGQGIGGELVENFIDKSPEHKRVWMQISDDNLKMQKTATKLGFKKKENWSTMGIWVREKERE